jgi:bifunctional UDP-N-acetylglucosamine pyrophosphorylase/glucosamine-1-phosphate N-acetyltransferase
MKDLIMTKKPLACVILTAGVGKRMKSATPKVMHEIAGQPMIKWLLHTVEELNPAHVIVVTAPDALTVAQTVKPHTTVVQQKPLGTGDAVKSALPILKDFSGNVLVLLGDMPLLSAPMMQELIDTLGQSPDTGVAVLGVEYKTPPAFGRLVLNGDKTLNRIVEDKDASPEERLIKLCNTGAFCINGHKMAEWLMLLDNKNAQGEFYITDLPAIAAKEGFKSRVCILHDAEEVMGVNSRADLAQVELVAQKRLRKRAMENGATLHDPSSVFFSFDTKTGRDVTIGPNVVFGPGVVIADNVNILPFCHIEGTRIDAGCSVGPFARLRPGTHLWSKVKIGNFVEVKNSLLHEGVKANHLAYIGDAELGAGTNFSCGAITVNYDGFEKHKTIVGENAMIGSNVSLVAPVTIGHGAYIAAGSTITKDIAPDDLAVERADVRIVEGWAANNRKKKSVK